MAVLNNHGSRRSLLMRVAPAAFASMAGLRAASMTNLRVIVEDEAGEPVSRASIVIGRLKKESSRKMKGRPLQLKTSMQGSAPLPPLEEGWYMLQVISQGHQTWGGKLELSGVDQEFTVRLKEPQDQFSVHKKDPK
jgi:hypothetical protein